MRRFRILSQPHSGYPSLEEDHRYREYEGVDFVNNMAGQMLGVKLRCRTQSGEYKDLWFYSKNVMEVK